MAHSVVGQCWRICGVSEQNGVGGKGLDFVLFLGDKWGSGGGLYVWVDTKDQERIAV